MPYARILSAPSVVKAKMFGLLRRSDVEGAVKKARQDFYVSNVEMLSPNSPLSLQLKEIAKRAGAARPEVRQTIPRDPLTDG